MAGAGRRVTIGAAVLGLALLGWVGTLLVVPLLQQPKTTEDLTTAWKQAGPTSLGESTAVSVPAGQTLVAFLVGTDLYGIAGTTTGACTAARDGRPLELGHPVHINRSLTDVLTAGQETVAVAGWTNTTSRSVSVEVRCTTGDSTVDHYVAVPTRTAVVAHDPWFQPWGWIATAVVGLVVIVTGVRRVNPPSR
jgi:hypothetical protein